jgi:hypothetical protein
VSATRNLQARYRAWREDGAIPYWIVWARDYRKPLVLGGRRRYGWLLSPSLAIDLRNLTFGVYWQRRGFEDPDPFISLHLPGIYLCSSIHRVAPGYRALARARAARLRAWGETA